MKILLFGEYSGLFNCLKDGLLELGHQVFLASDGDSFKNYPSDFRWDSKYKGRISQIADPLNVFLNLNKFVGYDLVLLISSRPLGMHFPYFNDKIFDFLIKNNGRVYLSGAGLDAYAFDYWYDLKSSKYFNYTNGYIQGAEKLGKNFRLYDNDRLKRSELSLFKRIDGYIPIMYEYAQPFRDFPVRKKTIPIPIHIGKFTYQPNRVHKKIVFFHGKTRACKGGEFIIKAFDILSQKYAKYAEFYCEGGLPFDDYIKLLQRTNVVLDDVNAYSLGMNGLFSMAQGRIVMGGAEPVANQELGYACSPAINLVPDVEQIVASVENILDHQDKLEEQGYESRKLVETYHNYITVTRQYLDFWSE